MSSAFINKKEINFIAQNSKLTDLFGNTHWNLMAGIFNFQENEVLV